LKKNTHNNRKTNRYLIYFSILFSILAVIIAVAIYLQIPKIGYIDSAILMQQYKGAIQASELFNEEKEEWENKKTNKKNIISTALQLKKKLPNAKMNLCSLYLTS
jgi:Skp family chaperone for outer membrane proteins